MSHPRHTSTDSDSRGFSLVEIVISVGILSTVLTASLRSQISSKNLMQQSRETELATELLHEALVELQDQQIDELIDPGGVYAPNLPLALPNVLAAQDIRYTTPGYTAGDPIPAILELDLTLQWTSEVGAARQLQLVGVVR